MRLALALIALASAQPGFAEQWLEIPTNAPNVIYAVDLDSVERRADTVRFRARLVYIAPNQRDEATGKLIKEKHMQRVMECRMQTQGLLAGALYADDQRMVEYVAYRPAQVTMMPIPSGTLAEAELKLVCARKAALK